MKKNKFLVIISFSVFLVLGMMSSAGAITITPDTELKVDCDDVFGAGGYPLLYKAEIDDELLVEEGTWKYWYATEFKLDASQNDDIIEATIKWEGSDPETDPFLSADHLYLYVKRGGPKDVAGDYCFDLLRLDFDETPDYEYRWDGMDSIFIDGFDDPRGSISNVAIYGDAPPPIPEPATMLLLGAGLIGLAGLGRKKFFKRKV